jgi:peptidoglycan/xylan/chitin deacetylase (PgdA/CDA1 family)
MKTLTRRLPFRIIIRRYQAILAGCLILVSGAVVPSGWDPPLRDLPRPPVYLAPKHPWIALTFDDGPHGRMTERLLQVLREQQVPGTFFVVGKMAVRHPELLKEIAREGHEVANHTYSHQRLTDLDDPAILRELAQTRAVVRRLTGQDSPLYRPPGGDYTRHLVRMTSQAGYRMVLWTVLTKDVNGASIPFMRRRILRHAEDGAIILMHSGIPNTVEMLPGIVAELRSQGYSFVTVSQLMGLPTARPYQPPYDPVVRVASKK